MWALLPAFFNGGFIRQVEQYKATDIFMGFDFSKMCRKKLHLNTEWRNVGLVRECLSGGLTLPRLWKNSRKSISKGGKNQYELK